MGRKIVWSSDDDDDFPSLDDLIHLPARSKSGGAEEKLAPRTPPKSHPSSAAPPTGTTLAAEVPSSVRLRKLVRNGHQDNPLLRRLETRDVAGSIKPVASPESRKQRGRKLVRGRPARGDGRIESKYWVCSSEDEGDASAPLSDPDSPPLQKDTTVPNTPGRRDNGRLGSPSKLPGIPKTPHRPSIDMFWSREFVDDWNDEHSPVKKLSFASPKAMATKSDSQPPARLPPGPRSELGRQSKKAFESKKHELARSFLDELDTNITGGKLGELVKETGGIKLNWTNKLNTTAGRANWKRESVRTSTSSGVDVDVQHKHHASIDLAEKVIDDEARLLNVVAHEFCHLANFIISGVTGNPHGKEFKAWAAKCTAQFGSRGIQVTTKHTYEIDFKYVWQCTECGLEFKRHSKSINPERHRCGSCKNLLQQIKPKPRIPGKESEYHKFVREQMNVVKAENPGSPQKDVMRLVAKKWAKAGVAKAGAPNAESIVEQLDKLTLET